MSDKEAGKLILADLAMFNQAVLLFEKEVSPEIQKEFADAIEAWAKQDDRNWLCNIDWDWGRTDRSCIWVAPPKWRIEGVADADRIEDASPFFALVWADGTSTDSYPLVELCGVGSKSMGFSFEINNDTFPGVNAKVWKNTMKPLCAEYAEKLKLKGFDFDGDIYFIQPLKLDSAKLAKDYDAEDYNESFAPLLTALDALGEAWPIFDEMITKARESLKLSTCSV